MILSVFAYNVEPESLRKLIAVMGDVSRSLSVSFRMEVFTDNITDAVEIIRKGEGVLLTLVGVDDQSRDPNLLSIRLGRMVKKRNRDNYVVYVFKDAAFLQRALPYCSGASGIVLLPATASSCKPIFEHVLSDFGRLYGGEQQTDENWIHLKAKGKVYRVRCSDICSIQAVNKMIEVHTMKQTITLADKLENLEQELGDAFVRCHRSYLINKGRIEYIDFKDRMIHMMDGSGIPFSRSAKNDIQRVAQESGD